MEKIVIGIDISAKTLDICVKKRNKKEFFKIENTISKIKSFFKHFSKTPQTIVAMENTGKYNWFLYEVLEDFVFQVFVINPLHLKKSLGLIRGKNDEIDAERIADFTDKNQEMLHPWKPDALEMKKLKVLFSERNSKVKLKAHLLKLQHNYTLTKSGCEKSLLRMNQQEIKLIEKHISALETAIEAVIKSTETLSQKANLLKSVPGVGKVLCWLLLVKTGGFEKITKPRQLACYAGVVPFDYQSGTAIRYKPRVSFYADKSLKSILHLAAMSAIRLENDLRAYYLRKVAEGKNKMLVLNNVRNKIVHRVFAVINQQKPYEKNYINSLVLS
ncbi:IS110 family transposase [Chryseobacterium sp. C39-AII1]|uniref:IS110 family transposase n=1 Tax=Chryseobacterium sp. C39-AII1 TaxID=3080332 RepID=UPI00320B8A0C